MDTLYDATKEKDLVAITIGELARQDRILYLSGFKNVDASHKKRLGEIGKRLCFFVDKEMEKKIPLKMQLYDNQDTTLIPNCPAYALVYIQDGIGPLELDVDALGIGLPCGYRFDNRMCAPAGDMSRYFEKSESGWLGKAQGKMLDVQVTYQFDRRSFPTKSKTVVRYGG